MRFQKRFRYAEPFLSLPEAVAHLSVPVEEAACIDSILVSLRISFRSLDIDDEFRSEIENLLKTGIAVGILKTVESTLSQIRRRRARGTSGLWPSSP